MIVNKNDHVRIQSIFPLIDHDHLNSLLLSFLLRQEPNEGELERELENELEEENLRKRA